MSFYLDSNKNNSQLLENFEITLAILLLMHPITVFHILEKLKYQYSLIYCSHLSEYLRR